MSSGAVDMLITARSHGISTLRYKDMLDTHFEADCNAIGYIAGSSIEEAIAARHGVERHLLVGRLLIVKEEVFGHLLVGQRLRMYRRVNLHDGLEVYPSKDNKTITIDRLYKPHVSCLEILVYMKGMLITPFFMYNSLIMESCTGSLNSLRICESTSRAIMVKVQKN